jgi:hypothetical protein
MNRVYGERLAVVAAGLESATANELSADGAVWAQRIAVELLRRAEQIPIGQRATLVHTCEVVLNHTQIGPVAASPAINEDPVITKSLPAPLSSQEKPVNAQVFENLALPVASPPEEVTRSPEIVKSIRIATKTGHPIPREAPQPLNVRWEPKWNAPAVSQQPAIPMTQPEAAPVATVTVEPSDRDLMSLWLIHTALPPVAGVLERAAILACFEQTLATRGFRSLRIEWAVSSLSKRRADRMRLVDALLVSFSSDAPAWLLLLAHDESPQVRRAAILALITSRDRRILALTHDLALRDRDPQVAALAPQIGRLLR